MTPIRIVLVDDHQLFREGLRAVLERTADIKVVGEASDGRAGVEMTIKLKPEIVIIDIGMRELNGIDATRQICSFDPAIRVIALSAHNDRRYVAAMFEVGAMGYVLKEAASEQMISAIRAVHSGRKFLCPGVADYVIDGYIGRASAPPAAPGGLAPREREVVQLLAEGASSKYIAARLQISVKTVETHRRNIMRKLNIHSVAAITKYAIREGMTSTEH